MELEQIGSLKDLGKITFVIALMAFITWKVIEFFMKQYDKSTTSAFEHQKELFKSMIENDKEMILAKTEQNKSLFLLNESVVRGSQIISTQLDSIQKELEQLYTLEQGLKDHTEIMLSIKKVIADFQELRNTINPTKENLKLIE